MAGQGFDPTFAFAWPTARIGVMEGDSAVHAVHGPELEKLKAAGAACARQNCSSASTKPAPITSAGWMRGTPPPAATWTP